MNVLAGNDVKRDTAPKMEIKRQIVQHIPGSLLGKKKPHMASWVGPRRCDLFHPRSWLSYIRAHHFEDRLMSEVLSQSDAGMVVYLAFVQCQSQQPTTVQLGQRMVLLDNCTL